MTEYKPASPLLWNQPMSTCDTMIWVHGVVRCGKIQYHTHTHKNCFGNTMGFVPMQNPTDSGFHSTEESGHMLSTTNHLCTYMDGTKCRFTQKVCKKAKKWGASPKAQPQSEGYTSLALLKPLCSSKNFSDIKEDRGAHSNYIAYFWLFNYDEMMELHRVGQILRATGSAQLHATPSISNVKLIG